MHTFAGLLYSSPPRASTILSIAPFPFLISNFAMAASTSTAANPNNIQCYDVFINHRGPDVKETFAIPLYNRLHSHELRVFLDKPELEGGDFIISQIESAIKTASVQIAIFSEGYAESSWCLDELVSMLETLRTGAKVIPVFYNVKPSDLKRTRGKAGIYSKALEELEKKTTYDSEAQVLKSRYDSVTIEKWRNALFQAADISGFELKACNGDKEELLDKVTSDKEELLDKVVECVLKRVEIRRLNVADYPTGLDDKIKDFKKILLPKPHVVGIVGFGGVAKTTLVKEFFNQKRSSYNRSCFLSDIRENDTTPSLISLQNKLLKNFRSDMVIDNIDVGISTLQKQFLSNKALVILDDVDKECQVDALLPLNTVLHPDSLILITSRNIDVLSSRVDKSLIYTLTGLNTEHSRELFCRYSLSQPHPRVGFESLVDKFLEACDGLPLSLKVFGALVYGKEEAFWTEQLHRLYPLPSEIKDRLRISYDALHEEDQKIFLDIACFFTRYNRDTVIKIWEGSRWRGWLGIQNLQNRCLVTVDSENDIQMHDHIRDMGRDVAETSSPSRIWRWTDDVIGHLLQKSRVEVRGIKMDVSECNQDDDMYGAISMMRLQLLDTEEGILERIMKWVKFPNLIWLHWRKCSHSSLPSCITMKNLRVLQVSGSSLKTLWEETKPPEELRELEIYAPLRNIPKSIGRLKHLERIVIGRFLSGRVNLIELPEEFCDLKSLKALVLKECSRLKSLPDRFGKLTTLEHIDLSFCRNLERLPDSFGRLMNLQHIDLSNCHDLKSLPDSFGSLGNLQRIDLPRCYKLKRLPDSFGNLKMLQHINLSDCHGLRRLPDSFVELSNLQYIDLSRCHNLESLPDSFGNLTNLQRINLSNCHDLETLPDSFDNLMNLKHIDLSKCHNLERLPNSLRNLNESQILLEGCPFI